MLTQARQPPKRPRELDPAGHRSRRRAETPKIMPEDDADGGPGRGRAASWSLLDPSHPGRTELTVARGPPVGAGGQRIDAPLHLGRRGLPVPVEGGQLGNLRSPTRGRRRARCWTQGNAEVAAPEPTAHCQCGWTSARGRVGLAEALGDAVLVGEGALVSRRGSRRGAARAAWAVTALSLVAWSTKYSSRAKRLRRLGDVHRHLAADGVERLHPAGVDRRGQLGEGLERSGPGPGRSTPGRVRLGFLSAVIRKWSPLPSGRPPT